MEFPYHIVAHILGDQDDPIIENPIYKAGFEASKQYFSKRRRAGIFLFPVSKNHYLCILRVFNRAKIEDWKLALSKVRTNIQGLQNIAFYSGINKSSGLDVQGYLKGINVYFHSEEMEEIPLSSGPSKEEKNWRNSNLYDYTYTFIAPYYWTDFFEANREVIKDISDELEESLKKSPHITFYPPLSQVFRAFELCPEDKVKVIVIGQDPYPHNPGEATGLAFSISPGITVPVSLRNIFNELITEGFLIRNLSNGDLSSWAKKGVLLINTALTVEAKRPLSHSYLWTDFFTRFMVWTNKNLETEVVWALWGASAQKYKNYIDTHTMGHKITESPHPASRSIDKMFVGSGAFKAINEQLEILNKEFINWSL